MTGCIAAGGSRIGSMLFKAVRPRLSGHHQDAQKQQCQRKDNGLFHYP